MDLDDIREGSIVYLRFMHFPDDNSIDYRLNGRPYLLYKIIGSTAYLFGMTTKFYGSDDFYFETERKTLKGNVRKTYINLKNYYKIELDDLIKKINELRYEQKFIKIEKEQYISDDELSKITERIELLCLVDSYKEKMR